MIECHIEELEPQLVAAVRDKIAVDEMAPFFGRAFETVMQVLGAQGVDPTGPPLGFYPSMPGATVEVAAGFPIGAPIDEAEGVSLVHLPGGRAVTAVHQGPYDTLEQSYTELTQWVQAEGLELGEGMWESYLSDPDAEPDPANWLTRITWPLR
jgi:effector-binding domain-containing protein